MNYAIILAAGYGERMKSKQDKLLLAAGGHPIIYYSIMAFSDHPEIKSVVVVANKFNEKEIKQICQLYRFKKVEAVILGGANRQESFIKGFRHFEKKAKRTDLILAHNGANPLPSFQEISDTIAEAKKYGACIVGHPVSSTIKEVSDTHIIKTHDRKKLFAAETPQAAEVGLFKSAIQNAEKKKIEATDEAMLLEAMGHQVKYIQADEHNFKITTQSDYLKLKTILGDVPEDYRVGIGQDSHVFENDLKGLVLAGVKFPEELKLRADSDGDVILHALFNALSQSIGEMSIGFYADAECKHGVTNSEIYLGIILKKVREQKFTINSVGIMIEGSSPKIDPIVSKLKKSLARILDINVHRIGITATTGEKCTVFGEGLGMQCFAIVSLIKEKE